MSLCESGAYFVETSSRVDTVPVATVRNAATGIAVMQVLSHSLLSIYLSLRARSCVCVCVCACVCVCVFRFASCLTAGPAWVVAAGGGRLQPAAQRRLSRTHSVTLCHSVTLSLCHCMSACLSVCLSVCLSICLSVCLSVCPSVCLSLCPSVSLSLRESACAGFQFPERFTAKADDGVTDIYGVSAPPNKALLA